MSPLPHSHTSSPGHAARARQGQAGDMKAGVCTRKASPSQGDTARHALAGPSPTAWKASVRPREAFGQRWAWPPARVGVSLPTEPAFQQQRPDRVGVWQVHQPLGPSWGAQPSSLAGRVVQMVSTGAHSSPQQNEKLDLLPEEYCGDGGRRGGGGLPLLTVLTHYSACQPPARPPVRRGAPSWVTGPHSPLPGRQAGRQSRALPTVLAEPLPHTLSKLV